jgi:hypothetical protein
MCRNLRSKRLSNISKMSRQPEIFEVPGTRTRTGTETDGSHVLQG